MKKDLQTLLELVDKNYRVVEIQLSFDKDKRPQLVARVKLERNDDRIVLSSSQKEFVSHVGHLHSIPHITDDGSDFVYIDNPGRYFELQETIVDLFSGKQRELVICERKLENHQELAERVMLSQKNWITSEKNVRMGTTRLCQIFYDLGVLLIKDGREEFKLVAKDSFSLDGMRTLLKECKKSDLAVCFSAFIVGPEVPSKREEKSDAVIGLISYDLRSRQTLSFNLNSLEQFKTRIDDIGRHGLWECVSDLFERTKSPNTFRSFLPVPLHSGAFTPLPWFCYAFIQGIPEEIIIKDVKLDLPLFLAFGNPLLFMKRPSYSFDATKQVAFLMLGFREDHDQTYHQVRFDMSKGEPRLHLDYQVYREGEPSRKFISHSIIDYKDIWDSSVNLAIGFLLASAYDINFDTMIVPQKLTGIDRAFRNDPLTVYPLFVRSMASEPFKKIKADDKLFEILDRTAKGRTQGEEVNAHKLENMNLARQGRLTILGDIVYRRLLQSRKIP